MQIIPVGTSTMIANALPVSAPAGFVLTSGEAVIIGLIYIIGGMLMTSRFTDERRVLIKQIADEEENNALVQIPNAV